MKILKIKPLINKGTNKSQLNILNEHNRNNTEKVSIACEVIVEKLFLTQSILPLVIFFQKW